MVDVERLDEHVLGVLSQAREDLRVGACHAGGRLDEPLAVGVLPDREQDLADGRFEARKVDLGADHVVRLSHGAQSPRPGPTSLGPCRPGPAGGCGG